MLILMHTFPQVEYDESEYDYAIVKIEEAEAKLISTYYQLFDITKDEVPELLELVLKDNNVVCEFYPSDGNLYEKVVAPELAATLDMQGWVTIPDDTALPVSSRDAHVPSHCYLIIQDNGFYWQATPQDSLHRIDTESLPIELLAQII